MWNTRSVAEMEADLVAIEVEVADARARQLVLVNELDKAQAPQTDGSRSMVEWVQAHMDVKRDTARDLVFAARRFVRHRGLHHRMLYSGATFDRTVAAVKLADTGVAGGVVVDSYGHDLGGVARLTAANKFVKSRDERDVFAERFFTMEPNLDGSSYRMWGQAPGAIGRTIEKAIGERADELRRVAGDLPSSRAQRQLDAFTAMAQDSLDSNSEGNDGTHRPDRTVSVGGADRVTVFVDATMHDPAGTSAEIECGPRVGPDTLQQILCSGRVGIVGLDERGIPVVTSPVARTIPPAIRHTVIRRDGGCVIDGCGSRYRLEPHHVIRWADGGSHHPDNLVTLCWYHHHVAIHGNGYRIDPGSPPRRRRLIRGPRRSGADPPQQHHPMPQPILAA